MTLKDLGGHSGFSRERARQLEIRAKEKLRHELSSLKMELEYGGPESPAASDEAAGAWA